MVPSIMANSTYVLYGLTETGNQYISVNHSDTSQSSPKGPNGKLKLRQNPCDWKHAHLTRPRVVGPDKALGDLLDFGTVGFYPNVLGYGPAGRLTTEALARFTGKVRKHNASLGVSIASWNKSLDMIRDRSFKIAHGLDARAAQVAKLGWRTRKNILTKNTAGAFLEGQFGWVPLFQDVVDGLDALGRTPVGPFVVSASARTADQYVSLDQRGQTGLTYWRRIERIERWKATVSGTVSIDNENAWLANRLGLLNLPGVAWDLTPWSWVVNIFSNASQMVNSLTDFVGITLTDTSTTMNLHAEIQNRMYPNPVYAKTYAWNQQFHKYTRRTTGLPQPKFYFKWPKLSLGLIGIAAALPLQRIDKIERLLKRGL